PLFSAPCDPDLGAVHQVQHHGYQYEGEEGGEGEAENYGPGQGPPEDHVVTSQKDPGIVIGEQSEKVDVEADGQGNQSQDGGNGRQKYGPQTRPSARNYDFKVFFLAQ